MKNKKQKLLRALLAVFAVGLIGAGAVACKDDEPEVPSGPSVVQGGPDFGVYYYNAGAEEYLLTLTEGNFFTFSLNGESKWGAYSWDGTKVSFDFLKAEDGEMIAGFENGVITVTYNNAQLRFLKKVNYTVSFDSKGGSEVAPVSVLNGQTVKLPANPERTGYVFSGWYIDEACTTPLNASDVITANTQLYAGWVEVVAGQTEYEVSFDLNYDGLVLETVKTSVGKLSGVPTPERAGYQFAGWWISDYQDATQLSYKYQDNMVFTQDTTLYALWVANPVGDKLPAPLVEVTENGVSWNGVTGAMNYSIVVTGPQGFTKIEETVGGTSKSIDFASMPAGDYTVSVTANASNVANSSETTVRNYKNKVLARVSQYSVLDSWTFVFEPVENATGYYITVDCGIDGHAHESYYLGDSTYYHFSNCALAEDGITFEVTAVAPGYASSTSAKYTYNNILDAVTGLSMDAATQTFVWNKVANAMEYVVTLKKDNVVIMDKVAIGNVNKYSLKTYDAGNYEISVYPVTKGYNSPAAVTATYEKENLAAPTDIKVVDTILSWSDVGAESYSIMLGNKVISNVQGTSYDLVTAYDWELGADYAVSIKANGAKESLWSDAVDMRYYAMNNSLSFKNGQVSWQHVIGAVSYEVKLNDGDEMEIEDGSTSLPISFNKAGKNTISVRFSDGNVSSKWATIDVYVYAVEFDTRGGESVPTVYKPLGDRIGTLPETTKAGYTLEGWYNAPGGPANNAAKYDEKDYFNAVNTVVMYAYWTPKTYNVSYEVDEKGTAITVKTPVQYMSSDYKLEIAVPTSENKTFVFAGWYTGRNGSGTRLTDDLGNAIGQWKLSADTTVYAYFTEVFKFNKLANGTYSVSKGKDIGLVTSVTIPTEYNHTPVTVVDGYSFDNCYYLRTVNIPNTIKTIEVDTAFYGCSRIENVNIYDAGATEVFFESQDGVLIRVDPDTQMKELAFFPRAKGGSYVIPQGVTSIPYKLFAGSKITDVTIPTSVTQIHESAFFECAELTSVIFEGANGATVSGLQIADAAFQSCIALTTVSFPARTAYLAMNSSNEITIFKGCSSLRAVHMEDGNTTYASIDGVLTNAAKDTIVYCPTARRGVYEIPSEITQIGNRAFYNCVYLTEIVVHNNMTSIGERAFYNCSNVIRVTFKGRAMEELTVGKYAFASNSKLKEVTFADGSQVVSLGDYAFSGCTVLKNFTFPATMTSVGQYAFQGCSGLVSVAFAPDCQDITFGNKVFMNCKSLTSINLPATITTLPLGAFEGCDNIKGIYVDDNNANFRDIDGVVYSKDLKEIYFYSKLNGNITFPTELEKIHEGVFKNNTNITTLYLGENIKTVGNDAFLGCSRLTSVTIAGGSNALTLGTSAFNGCYLLETINIPTRVTKISNRLLNNAISLNELELHNGITEIGSYAFASTALSTVNLPEGLTKIGDYAFNRTLLSSVVLPTTLTSLGKYAFANCGSLTSVDFSKASITVIPEGAFKETRLTSVTIPNTFTQVGAYAFDKVATLTEVTFQPGGTADLILGAADAEFDESWEILTYYSFAFAETGITSIELPARLTRIGEGSFYHCMSLSEVTFETGSRLMNIGVAAFGDTAIESFSFPNTLQDIWDENEEYMAPAIGNYAFSGLQTLTSVTFAKGGENTMTLAQSVFDGTGITAYDFPKNVAFYSEVYWTCNSPFAQFSIEAGGPYLTVNNFIYSKDGTKLILAPRVLQGDVVIPYSVATKNGVPTPIKSIQGSSFNSKLPFTVTFENANEPLTENKSNELKIANGAFQSAPGLTSIVLPERLTSIGSSAFKSTQLTSINIPKNVTLIDQYAFNTASLTSVTFDGTAADGNLQIKNYAFQGTKMTSIEFPANTYILGGSVLTGNSEITSITFAEGCKLVEIGDYAFQTSKITEIVIPRSVNKIGKAPFGAFIEKVTLSDHVSNIATLFHVYRKSGNNSARLTTVKEVIVPATNTYLKNGTKVVGGETVADTRVVYTADGTQLLYFANGADATGFVIPEEVTLIGANAFRNQVSLTSIEITANVTEIARAAFFGASNLKTLTFADREKNLIIGDFAFMSTRLTGALVIPREVDTIGYAAFAGDNNYYPHETKAQFETERIDTDTYNMPLTSVTFEDDSLLTSIGGSAFRYSMIESFEVPNSVATIGNYFVSYCPNLTSLAFEENNTSLMSLPTYCFYNLPITTVKLPQSITSISNYAFQGCTELTSIEIPENVKTIGTYAFYGCTSLQSITISGNVGTINNYAFQGCTSLKTLNIQQGVEKIGNYAFQGCTALEEVVIPNTVTSLGTYAFQDCTNLKSVELSARLTTLSGYMFKDCTSLESINIPGTITSIATNAFENCVNLVEVTLQSGVTSIGNNAFKGCLKMTTLELPDTITTLGTGIFDGAPLFEGFKLAGNNLSYKEKDGVIYNYEMNRLVNFPIAYTGSYEIPETITEILAGTFAGSMLSEVVIPASITTIPKDAFKGCTQLTHVILHDGVSTISDGAFYGCTSLTKISSKEGSQVVEQLPSGLRTIGKESFYKTALKNVHIGAFVTTIGDYAFAGGILFDESSTPKPVSGDPASVNGLENLTFATDGREELHIGKYAFANTKLTSVEIPFRVRSSWNTSNYRVDSGINEYAFAFNTQLEEVTFATIGDASLIAPTLTFGKGAFRGCTALEEIELPAHISNGSYREYDGDCWAWCAFFAFSGQTFMDCTNLTSVTFAESTNYISFYDYEFAGCTSLETFEFPEMTYGFNSYMFKDSGIKEISVPNPIDPYTNSTFGMFQGCTELTTVTIADEIAMQSKMFEGCTKLQYVNATQDSNVNLTAATSAIFTSLFKDCSSLTGDFVVPERITQIHQGAFAGCTGFNSITLHAGVTRLDTDNNNSNIVITERVFTGWTADQTIILAINQDEVPQPTDIWSGWKTTWLDGCQAKVQWKDGSITNVSTND